MSQRLLFVCVSVSLLAACGNGPNTGTGGGTGGAGGGDPNPPTYYKDVLPITQVSCNGCHVAGGIAPFALDTYEAAKLKAPLIADAVTNRRMPPWLASKECGGPFVGDRSLSDGEIAILNAWFQGGAREGNPADAPHPAGPGEVLPKVDLEKQMLAAYTPTIRDDYRCFIIDPALAQERVVTGYDILPGSRKVVHHVIMYVVPRTSAVTKDAQDTTPGWECFGGANVRTDGTLGAWAPGGSAVIFPAGTGIRVGPNQVIAMQVHYNTDNGSEADQTAVKLMYGTGNERSAFLIPLVADNFSIPAGAVSYAHSENFPNSLGFDLNVWGFLPHMHTKGKKISLTSIATSQCLVDIPRWDFHWQTQYFRKTAVQLSHTNGIRMSCTWDNPTNSVVTWGEGTSDEMCFAFIYATL